MDVEVERLLAPGATQTDVGQGEQSSIVLADAERNEVCVIGSRSLSAGDLGRQDA
jgi:hypothetical protein